MESVMNRLMNELSAISLVTVESLRSTRYRRGNAVTADPPELGFTLYNDGFCSDFWIKRCLQPSKFQILKIVRACPPFGPLPNNWKEPLKVRIVLASAESSLTCTKIERIQAEQKFLEPYIETVLTRAETFLANQIQFKSPHAFLKLNLRLNRDGTTSALPNLTGEGVSTVKKGGLAAIIESITASPFGTLPSECQKLRVVITTTGNGSFASGACVDERRRKSDQTLFQQRKLQYSRRKN